MSAAMTRAQLARRAGCHIETIRHWEKVGLMPPPRRAANGYRVYGEADLARLRFILRARDLGFGSSEIRELLAMAGGEASCAEVAELAARHLAAVRARLRDLARIEAVLADTLARCSGPDAPACPVLEVLSGAGEAPPQPSGAP